MLQWVEVEGTPREEDAYARMRAANAHLNDEQARHLTVHGSNQNEDGSFSWKYDNYTHAFPLVRLSDAETTDLWRQGAAPALVINEKVVMSGQLPKISELKSLLTNNV